MTFSKVFNHVVIFVSTIGVMVLIASCKKNTPEAEIVIAQSDFFKIPASASQNLKTVIEELRKQNDQNNITNTIIEKYGVPMWENAFSNEREEKENLLYYIPLRKEGKKSIEAFISCLKINETYSFKMLYKPHLEKTLSSDAETQNWIRGMLYTFSYFEKKINNIDSIFIKGYYNSFFKYPSIYFERKNTVTAVSNAGSSTSTTSNTWIVTWTRYCQSEHNETVINPGKNNTANTRPGGYYCWNVYTYSSGGSNIVLGTNPAWYENTGGTTSGGLNTTLDPSILSYLCSTLSLNETQSLYLLENPLLGIQLNNYLTSFSPTPQSYIDNAHNHLENLMQDPAYLAFVQNQIQNSTTGEIWWEDDAWLDNPTNFNLDIDAGVTNAPIQELTPEEKVLVALYPIQAYKINRNASTAQSETVARYGTNGLNDKSDAFRHTFWLAINTKSIGSLLALLFSNAHETQVPSQLQLEKTMDLHNNSVGIGLCPQPYLTVEYLAQLSWNAVQTGECRYLSPIWPPKYNPFTGAIINPNGDPDYWGAGGTNNINTATHGITNQTQVIPTNQ